ncbi:MAG: hypothetical protein COA79_00710 [Planctomycetota bacterium]|nr:MAG: hypothetical protein COA79_00710 [Planctomycetota bacterium]
MSECKYMEEILVIDDNEGITETIHHIFKEVFAEKYTVTTFNDSELAFEYYKNNGPFDKIILDLDMPKLSGDTMIPMIRDLHQNQKILIITGKDDLSLEQSLYESYPEYKILKKPFSLEDFTQEF